MGKGKKTPITYTIDINYIDKNVIKIYHIMDSGRFEKHIRSLFGNTLLIGS